MKSVKGQADLAGLINTKRLTMQDVGQMSEAEKTQLGKSVGLDKGQFTAAMGNLVKSGFKGYEEPAVKLNASMAKASPHPAVAAEKLGWNEGGVKGGGAMVFKRNLEVALDRRIP